jgi:hypothetical protein
VNAAIDTLEALGGAQLAKARTDLDTLDDVRGRFKALRAKAALMSLYSSTPELLAQEAEIAAAFRARPIALATLLTLIKSYEVAMRRPVAQPVP